MINVAPLRSAVTAAPGDLIAVDKKQLAVMFAEIEIGNSARRALAELDRLTALRIPASVR